MTGAVLSVVVIGRNEEARLEACLRSVWHMVDAGLALEVIYVDSGSTDGSVRLAEALGAFVIELRSPRPTAAMGRNAGWRASRGTMVLFLDGDTILDREFVWRALPAFADGRVAAVCGRRVELRPLDSIYNRIFDLDWNGPAGVTDYCGGDALFRREALEAADGYDATLIAGEEPEMCTRLRLGGWKIIRMDLPMTSHDLAMRSAGQWWRRGVRTGYAYAQIAARFAGTKMPLWSENVARNRNRMLAFAFLVLAGPVGLVLAGTYLLFVASAGVFALLFLRTAAKARQKTRSWVTALLYGVHSHLQQVPIFVGRRRYARDVRGKVAGALIEYK